jgi:hypothetical protein
MSSNRLQLNAAKTEVLWIASSRKQHLLPKTPFLVANSSVQPVSSVRDLGIYLDSDMLMHTHIAKTTGICFGALRALRSVSQSLPRPVLKTLVSALILSRLDYGNALLYGLPDVLVLKLQSVLNAAARLIYGASSTSSITPLLNELHWLHVRERITFKIACLTWRCLNGFGPSYLASSLSRASSTSLRSGLRSGSSLNLVPPRTRNVTHGDRSWPAAAAKVWNNLGSLQSEPNYLTFRRRLKTFLFEQRP